MTKLVIVYSVSDSLVFLEGQASFLQRNGLGITVVTSPSHKLVDFAAQNGIAYAQIPISRKISPFSDILSLVSLYRFFRSIRPGIVHGNTPKGGLLSMCASWLARVPVRVYTIHGFPFETASGFKRRLLKLTEKISCRLATKVLCVSPSLQKMAVDLCIAKQGRIGVLGNGSCNGVDSSNRFNPLGLSVVYDREGLRLGLGITSQTIVIGFVGRFVIDKGIRELFLAWKMLQEKFSNLHLIVVGAMDTRDGIAGKEISLYQSYPGVTFIPQTDVIEKYYFLMDVFVLPTYREGLPTVLLEAAAMELPVIATDTTGCKDVVVPGITGLLVPPRSEMALFDAISTMIRDEEMRKTYGRNARKFVIEKFDNQLVWSATLNFYKEQIAGNV